MSKKDRENRSDAEMASEFTEKKGSPQTLAERFAATAREYAGAAAYFAFCAVMSSVRFAFGTYPFGFALLCAAEGRRYAVAALLGVAAASAFTEGGGYVALCAIVIFLCRMLCSLLFSRRRIRFSKPLAHSSEDMTFPPHSDLPRGAEAASSADALFSEDIAVRSALAAAGAIVVGGIAILFHSSPWRAAAGIAISAATAPILCVAFSGFFRRERRTPAVMCLAACAFCASWVLCSLNIGMFNVGAFFALFCAFVAAHFLAIPEAIVGALIVSLPLDFAVIPAVLLATAAYAFVRRHFVSLAPLVGAMTALFFALGALGLSASSRYGGEFLAASALVIPIARVIEAASKRTDISSTSPLRVLLGGNVQKSESAFDDPSVRELRSLSDCFLSLGDLAKDVSSKLCAPSEEMLRERVDRSFERHCVSCPDASRCDGAKGHSDYRRDLAAAMRRGENASSVALSDEVRRCPELAMILRSLEIRDEDAPSAPSVFARDMSELGELLADASDKIGSDNVCDDAASAKLRRDLALAGLHADSVRVASPRLRKTRITGIDPSSFHASAQDVREWVSRSLGCDMSEPKIAVGEGGLSILTAAKEKFRVVMGKCSIGAVQGVCGDSAAAFVSPDGRFRALLSDGMGSGGEAAFTAMTVTLFLKRLLSAGVSMASALRLTNCFLRDRRIECSATVDVAEIDLVKGGAKFYKSGAAPSFVLRAGKLFKLRSRTVPIGILPAADAEAISFDVTAGDVILMMSDGVTRDDEECPWLYDVIAYERMTNLSATARRIAKEAQRRSPDDVTVMLIRIERSE